MSNAPDSRARHVPERDNPRRTFGTQLSHLVSAIRRDPRRLTLLTFLRILFWDGRIQEAALREQQARRHAEYHGPERAPRQAALAAALERVAGGKKPVVPRILNGVLDSEALQNLVTNHMAEVTAAKELYKEHDTVDEPIAPNWSGCAEQFFFDQARDPWPDSPWEEVVGKLIGKCRVPGIDASFVCEWVAREASFAESDPKTAELARLEGEGILGELLAELRNRFPQKAEEWFGAEAWQSANMPPATMPGPATTSEQNHATGSAGDSTPSAEPAAQGRVPIDQREKKVADALTRLTSADTRRHRRDKIRAVRITDVERKTGLKKSSVATTSAWKTFEQKRKVLGLSPKPFGKNKSAERPLSDGMLNAVADPNASDPNAADPAEDPAGATASDANIWEALLGSAATPGERERLESCTPAERRKLIELSRSQREEQRHDSAPRRPQPFRRGRR
jgi:hypothetical protein